MSAEIVAVNSKVPDIPMFTAFLKNIVESLLQS